MTWVRALPARWRIRRTVIRVASRDFGRRPAQSALVVAGLLVSSLVISAALVAGDSIEGLFLNSTLSSYGPIDVVAGTMSASPFSEADALTLASSVRVKALSKGSAQRLLLRGAVEDVTRDTREPEISVIGVDAVRDRSIGEFPGQVGGPSGESLFINRRLAQRLSAKVGDQLSFLAAAPNGAVAFDFKVKAVLPNSGKADNGRSPNAFIALDTLQSVASMKGQVNRIVFSSKNADSKSLEEAIHASSSSIGVRGAKRVDVKDSKEQTRIFRAILGMLGSIVALASVALIANLFVMLGEERRQDRGTMRALGLKRSGLVLLGVSEGVFYAVAAAAVGAIVGAFFGRYLADSMGDLFTRFAGNDSFEFVRAPFKFRPRSLIFAGVGGFVISLLSVLAVTVRTSRMNIIASIKGLNEDHVPKGRRLPARQIIILVLGVVAAFAPGVLRVAGGSLMILGLSSLLSRFLSKRVGATIGGVAGLAWGLWTNTFLPDFDKDPEAALALVTVAGVVSVVSVVVLITANLNIMGPLRAFFGTRSRMVFRIATAYAEGFRFRTAMSMGMFGLVVYMIATFAIWGGFGGGDVEKEKGGFDVLARSTVPIEDLKVKGASLTVAMQATLYTAGYRVGDSSEVPFPARMYGVNRSMSSSDYTFSKKPKGLSARQVWTKLATEDGYAVLDRATNPGAAEVNDFLVLKTDSGRTARLKVIGIIDAATLRGIFISRVKFSELFPARTGDSAWLIRAEAGQSDTVLARRTEREFARFGFDANAIDDLFREDAATQRSFVGIFQLLLKLGLVIGISGLAIGALRTVLERRQAIGILRAMGFGRGMVAFWLILETLLVATLGVGAGLGVGLLGTFLLLQEQITAFEFNVDWSQIINTLVIIYGAVLIFTALPAVRAARLKPSEAVRYVE